MISEILFFKKAKKNVSHFQLLNDSEKNQNVLEVYKRRVQSENI